MVTFPDDQQAWINGVTASLSFGAEADTQALVSIGVHWGLNIYLEAIATLKTIPSEQVSTRVVEQVLHHCSQNQAGLPVDAEGNLPRIVVGAAAVAVARAFESDPEADWFVGSSDQSN